MTDLVIDRPARMASAAADEPSLAVLADALGYTPDWNWSWENYRPLIERISAAYGLRRHLDIGGGRDPLFTPAEADALGLEVTLNDISEGELARAPAAFAKVHCDVAAADTMSVVRPGAYDFVYSRMVQEHVRDARRLWANQYAMLAPGGVALAFFPTLYAPAFALNRLVPEAVSSAIVGRLFPDRHGDGENPKFPAYYDLCYGDPAKVVPSIEAIGFRDVLLLPFYGYSYFWRIPVLKGLDAAFTRLSRARDWRAVTSFAILAARK